MEGGCTALGDKHPRAVGVLTVDTEGTMQITMHLLSNLVSSQVLFLVLAPPGKEDYGHRPIRAWDFRAWSLLYSQEPSKVGDTPRGLLKYGEISV